MIVIDVDWNRALSALVALIYLITAFVAGGGELMLRAAIFLVLPMAGIWFSEGIGSYTGNISGKGFPVPVEGPAVKIAAWLLLISPVIAGIIIEATK